MVNRFVVSADSKYFLEYGPSLFMSCAKNRMNLAIQVIDPDKASMDLADKMIELSSRYPFHFIIEFDASPFDLTVQPYEYKSFCACGRIRYAHTLAKSVKDHWPDDKFFMLDIDSIVRRNFEYPNSPLAFYMRDNEPDPGMKLLASGIIQATEYELLEEAISIMDKVGYGYWFLDQWILFSLIDKIRHKLVDISTENLLDWEFGDGAIWYAKGPRKTNPEYMKVKDALESEFNECFLK